MKRNETKIEIKSMFGWVLFEHSCEDNTIKKTLEEAVKARANLARADLVDANLARADLVDANLAGANLADAKNADLILAQTSIVPDTGSFTAWKKCKDGVVVKLLIPEDAQRSNASSRKCRASKAQVLEVIGAEEGISSHDNKTIYRAGETVVCDGWDENRWHECSGGIHFFITRLEAQNYDV